jgi:hypothetical protein
MARGCMICGGPHDTWKCPRSRSEAPPKAEPPPVRTARLPLTQHLAPQSVQNAKLAGARQPAALEPREPVSGKVPFYQPPGVCPSCDQRRKANARRMARHRERKG